MTAPTITSDMIPRDALTAQTDYARELSAEISRYLEPHQETASANWGHVADMARIASALGAVRRIIDNSAGQHGATVPTTTKGEE